MRHLLAEALLNLLGLYAIVLASLSLLIRHRASKTRASDRPGMPMVIYLGEPK